jgi:MFS family permease
MFSTFSLSMLVAQVGGGILADRLAMNRLLSVGFAALAAGAFVLPLTTSEAGMHLFAALFGTGQGMALAVSSTMWVRYYGRPNLGKIRGAVWCATVAGSGCGPFILGLVDDYAGSFTPGLWCFAAMLLPLAPLALWATPPQPRQSQATKVSPQGSGRWGSGRPSQREHHNQPVGTATAIQEDSFHEVLDLAIPVEAASDRENAKK